MHVRRIVALLAGLAVLAAACSSEGGSTGAAATGGDSSGPSDQGFGAARPASSGDPLPALEASGESPFTVDQVASTPREDVPSALEDSFDPSFPEPLVDPSRIRSGGPPPDGIPPLDDPRFERAATVDWLVGVEPVLAIEIDGEARAYPIQVMTWHELVNDTIGGQPVTISFCPLCNSALAYDRRLGDRILDFGTSGRLFNSSLVMYDRQTRSLWSHFDGRAVVGALTGEELTTLPVTTVSWQSFRDAYPDGLVLSRDTGFSRSYGSDPYVGYDDVRTSPFLFDGELDGRLPAKERVLVVRDDEVGGTQPGYAIPAQTLFDERVIEFVAQGRSLVAVLQPGVSSALDSGSVAAGYDTGATAVFLAEIGGRPVRLEPTGGGFLDTESGTTFDILGNAVDGSSTRLEVVEHLDTFWFAIAAFDPDTIIHGV
jgi:hypothetical protein